MRYACILIFLLSHQFISAQQVSPEVTLGLASWNCNEPSLAINPANPKECIILTNHDHSFHDHPVRNEWIHKFVKSPFGVYGDPVVLYDQQGRLFIVHLSKTKNKTWPEWFDRIVFQSKIKARKSHSVDIGFNGKMQDKPWISLDQQPGSKYKGNLYLTWTQFDRYKSNHPNDSSRILFSLSTDKGKHFSSPIVISQHSGQCMDDDETVEGATSTLDDSGKIYVVWAGHQQLYMNSSVDAGITWEGERSIMPMPSGWDLSAPSFLRSNGMPFIHWYDSRLFVSMAFTHQSLNRVYVIFSDDKGTSWSEPFALQKEDSADYSMPHSKIDPVTGTYYVLYYKVKNDSVYVLLSYKLKEEEGFHTIQVNDKPFVISSGKIFMGDYIAVDAYNNNVRMAWTEAVGLKTVVKTRQLKL